MYAAITPTQQLRALTWLLSAGHLRHCKGMSLDQVLELPIASRLVNMHAVLIAKGQHPHLSEAYSAHASYPVAALPITRRVDQPRLARPPGHPHHPKHYFDARSAAAGDLVDQEDVQQLCGPSPTPELMWQWAGGLLTWAYVAGSMELGEPEIELQLQLAATVIRRFAATRVVQLHVGEKELAKRGAWICDALAAEVTVALAMEAALWSEAQMLVISASAEAGSEIDLRAAPAQEAA